MRWVGRFFRGLSPILSAVKLPIMPAVASAVPVHAEEAVGRVHGTEELLVHLHFARVLEVGTVDCESGRGIGYHKV